MVSPRVIVCATVRVVTCASIGVRPVPSRKDANDEQDVVETLGTMWVNPSCRQVPTTCH